MTHQRFRNSHTITFGHKVKILLQNPSIAIPRGTFLAILLTTIVYLAIVWTCGGCMLRDAVGIGVVATNVTLSLDEIRNCGNETCKYGLQNSHAVNTFLQFLFYFVAVAVVINTVNLYLHL